ncbi:MAG TPA: flagellar motor switch protein FliM [Acidisphaera sp.]|nr:flagellar motor switch protein FliM [Acidisphaera sp.]
MSDTQTVATTATDAPPAASPPAGAPSAAAAPRRTAQDEAAEEAALAAAWAQSAARAGGAAAQAAPATDATGAPAGRPLGGIERFIRSGLVAYDRLPMLEVVFDRMVRMMSTSLRHFTNDNVEIALEGIESVRVGDHLDAIPLPAALAVIKAQEWDNHGLLIVDSAMICTVVDVLLGGRRASGPARIEGRTFTRIERTLAERLIRVVAADLSASFEPLCAATFRFERLEVHPRFATIVRRSNAAIVARLRIEMEDRGGSIEVLLPHGTLEPVRELLLQQFMGEKFGRDSIWEAHLAEELRNTEVELSAVLDEQTMRLSEIMALQTGSQIVLNVGRGAAVQMRCGTVPLFEGRVGRRKNRIAVRIEREAARAPGDDP